MCNTSIEHVFDTFRTCTNTYTFLLCIVLYNIHLPIITLQKLWRMSFARWWIIKSLITLWQFHSISDKTEHVHVRVLWSSPTTIVGQNQDNRWFISKFPNIRSSFLSFVGQYPLAIRPLASFVQPRWKTQQLLLPSDKHHSIVSIVCLLVRCTRKN